MSDSSDSSATETPESAETPSVVIVAPADGAGGTRAQRALAWGSIAGAGLLAVLVVVIAVLGYRTYAAHQVDQARSQGLSAARAAAGDVLSYDHRHLDKDFAKAEQQLAPGFAKQYTETTKTVVRPKALETEAVVTADVVAASVVSASEDRVVALLFVNQTTESNLAEESRTDLNRVLMTLDRGDDDRWLVAKLDAL